jgi:lipoprotein-anchoring transpeptidase ErfK/SrfK
MSKEAIEAQARLVNSGGAFYQIARIPRQVVDFPEKHPAGTIVIKTNERRLYYVLGNGQAIRYGIGVGRDGFRWSGVHTVSSKRTWPDWTPPDQMLKRRPDLPHHMAGGPENPLGARAMYLGSTLYRIHGSNEEQTIGGADSSGCIRMTNVDVIDLYERVKVGTTVIVRM